MKCFFKKFTPAMKCFFKKFTPAMKQIAYICSYDKRLEYV